MRTVPAPPRKTLAHVHRLLRWQRLALYACGALLLATGGLWLVLHYSVDPAETESSHPLEVWSLRLHGMAAFGGLFVLGVLAAAHIPHGWRLSHRRKWASQRLTGVTLCVLAGVLVLTGYLLYYFAPEAVRPALGWAHAVVGLMMALLIASHRRGV